MATLRASGEPMGTNFGSRLPRAKPATGPNRPSLKIYSVAGRASATCTSLDVLGAAAGVGQAGRQLQRLQQRRAAVGRPDRLQRPVQLPAVVGEALLDPRRVGETDEHGHVAGSHLVDQFAHPPLGLLQPRGGHVGGLHAGRVVHQEDQPVVQGLDPLPTRPQQRESGQQDDQQLQQQEQVPPQPLPDGVDVQVLDRFPPEVRAGHLDRPPLELQEIQQHDRRRHRRQQRPLPPGEHVGEVREHVTYRACDPVASSAQSFRCALRQAIRLLFAGRPVPPSRRDASTIVPAHSSLGKDRRRHLSVP